MALDIREATDDDNQVLQELQARCPMGATLIVSTVNTPDFFARARAYEWYKVYVACAGEEIAGSAACALRTTMVNGQPARVGYEFQYFTAPGQRRNGVASALHRHMARTLEQQGAVLSYLITIEGNLSAMRLFEGLGFRNLRTLIMPGILVYKEMDRQPATGQVRPAAVEDLEAIATLGNQTWQGFQLYEPASAASLLGRLERTPAYDLENLFVLEERGEIMAALGYWDWSQITRLHVQALSPRIRLIGLLLDLLGRFRPLPSGVHPGDTLKQVVLTPVAFRAPEHLAALIDRVNNLCLAAGIGQIFAVCEQGHPMLQALKGYIHLDSNVQLLARPLKPGLSLGDGPVWLDGQDL